jgi:hypothetical protein
MSAILPQLLAITALAIEPGGSATLSGAMQTTHDGARFDAVAMFDFEAGGLRVVEGQPGAVRVTSTGLVSPTCSAAGVGSPCLVPRVIEHAHARLLSVDELRTTLQGSYEVTTFAAPYVPPRAPRGLVAAAWIAGILALLAAVRGALARRDDTPLGRVDAAARAARSATSADATLGAVREEIERLVEHARDVDRVRRDCELALARVRRTHGERLAVEREEEAKLESDLRRSRARLTEIAAALRLVPLRVREARDVNFGRAPVDVILGELHLRDRAIAEVDR